MRPTHILMLATLLAACQNKKEPRTIEVEGTVRNTDAKMVYLEENIPNGRPTIMDSSELGKDGHFALKAPSKEEALYQLRLAGKLSPLALFISDVPKVEINADLYNSAVPYTVNGSPASAQLLAFDKTVFTQGANLFAAGNRVDSLRKASATDSLVSAEYGKVETAAASLKTYLLDFLRKSPSPVLTLCALSTYQNTAANLGINGLTQAETVEVIQSAAAKYPRHTALQNVAKTTPSAKAPDFSQPGVDSQQVSLSSFRGKWVLLDFWASWCKPCRMDNPNVVAAYNEFKDKNFTVFGVSLDQNREAWLKAIQQDGLTWTHASDLKFWNNEAAALYGVQSIPANFLIDPQGNIVAQDLYGEEIVKALRRVIK